MENPVVQRPETLDRIKENLNPHQLDSFFDHDITDPRDQKPLWVSPNKVRYNDQKHKIIMECPMEKQGRKIPSWKLRHFVLTEDFLAYKEKQASKNIKRVMALDRVRLEIVTSKENDKTRYGFQFSKNKKSASIFTTNQQLYEKFRNELEKRCILSTFDQTYEVEKLIGQGSFGKVYLVKRRSDGKEFAAKMFIKDKVILRTKGKLSLINEIKILRKLDHSGIMKLYKVYETMIGILLVMELLEGGELFEHLKDKKTFTERDCAFMLIRIMDPLVYMHDKQIAHRDIKPENLILRSKKDGFDIVIADFGLAESLSLPTLFVKCGSPGYCAPEILNAKGDIITYDTKCDVFSMGCVFYHMVTGKNPFWSKYPKETYHLNKSAAVVFEDPKVTALSTAAQDLLKKMLNKDPAQRPTFNECLKHYYFQEAFQVHHSPVVNFRLKLTLSGSSYHSHHKSGELELKEKVSLDSQGETISFIFGRSNIIKGKVDTLQEISTNIKTKQIKNNLLQLTNNVEDKQSSRRKSGSFQVQTSPKKETKDYESVGSSSDFDSLNESNEIGRLAWVGKPLEICSKVNKVKNEGIINNPFLEMASTDKDVSSGFIKLIVSESGKSSFTVFPTRFRHLNKSDDFRKIHM